MFGKYGTSQYKSCTKQHIMRQKLCAETWHYGMCALFRRRMGLHVFSLGLCLAGFVYVLPLRSPGSTACTSVLSHATLVIGCRFSRIVDGLRCLRTEQFVLRDVDSRFELWVRKRARIQGPQNKCDGREENLAVSFCFPVISRPNLYTKQYCDGHSSDLLKTVTVWLGIRNLFKSASQKRKSKCLPKGNQFLGLEHLQT